MTNEEYLASGILEVYAAGGLTQAEREEVERRAADSPEIHAALGEACAAMEVYARMHAISPRPELKNKILADFQNEDTADTPGEEAKLTSVYTIGREEALPYKWMFAASVVLFLLSAILSLLFYNRWKDAEEQLTVAAASEQLMAQRMETVSLRTQQMEEVLSVLRDPAYKPVRLQGVEGHPQANMMVYWNPEQQQVYIDGVELPAPPAGMQYQLWALDKGEPVDAGMISLQGDTIEMQKMKPIDAAQAFAVTLEPAGGSKNPTLEKLMVMGEVKV